MTPGPEDDISQAEKRYVMRQDADVRDRSRNGDTGTYLSHTHDDTSGGRFAAIGTPTVVGRDAVIKYPAAAAHQHDPCGPEPPTGYDINEMTPLDPSADSILPVEAAGDVPSAAQVPAAIRVAEYDKENPGKSNRVVADARRYAKHVRTGPHLLTRLSAAMVRPIRRGVLNNNKTGLTKGIRPSAIRLPRKCSLSFRET